MAIMAKSDQERAKRLAEALRANLRRRKGADVEAKSENRGAVQPDGVESD